MLNNGGRRAYIEHEMTAGHFTLAGETYTAGDKYQELTSNGIQQSFDMQSIDEVDMFTEQSPDVSTVDLSLPSELNEYSPPEFLETCDGP